MTFNWQSSNRVMHKYNKVVFRTVTPTTVLVIMSENVVSIIVMKFLIKADNRNLFSPGAAFVFASAVVPTCL
jgi:hypothetical protein